MTQSNTVYKVVGFTPAELGGGGLFGSGEGVEATLVRTLFVVTDANGKAEDLIEKGDKKGQKIGYFGSLRCWFKSQSDDSIRVVNIRAFSLDKCLPSKDGKTLCTLPDDMTKFLNNPDYQEEHGGEYVVQVASTGKVEWDAGVFLRSIWDAKFPPEFADPNDPNVNKTFAGTQGLWVQVESESRKSAKVRVEETDTEKRTYTHLECARFDRRVQEGSSKSTGAGAGKASGSSTGSSASAAPTGSADLESFVLAMLPASKGTISATMTDKRTAEDLLLWANNDWRKDPARPWTFDAGTKKYEKKATDDDD